MAAYFRTYNAAYLVMTSFKISWASYVMVPSGNYQFKKNVGLLDVRVKTVGRHNVREFSMWVLKVWV